MADRQVTVGLDFRLGGDAPAGLERMGGSARQLNESQAEFASRVREGNGPLEERQRLLGRSSESDDTKIKDFYERTLSQERALKAKIAGSKAGQLLGEREQGRSATRPFTGQTYGLQEPEGESRAEAATPTYSMKAVEGIGKTEAPKKDAAESAAAKMAARERKEAEKLTRGMSDAEKEYVAELKKEGEQLEKNRQKAEDMAKLRAGEKVNIGGREVGAREMGIKPDAQKDDGGMLGKLSASIPGVIKGFAGISTALSLLEGIGKSIQSGDIRDTIRSIPIVGGIFASSHANDYEAHQKAAEITEGRQGLTDAGQMNQARNRLYSEKREREEAGIAQIIHHEERAAAFGKVKLAPGPTADRSTHQGQIAYEEQEQRIPHLDRIETAKAERDAVTKEKSLSDARLLMRRAAVDRAEKARMGDGAFDKGTQGRVTAAQARVDVFQRKIDESGKDKPLDKPELDEQAKAKHDLLQAQIAEQTAINNALDRGKELEGEKARNAQLGLSVAQSESAVRKSNLEYAKSELEILKAREQRTTSQATSFGGKMQWEQDRALAVLRGTKGRKFEELSPYERQIKEEFAPNTTAKEKQASAERSPAYQAAKREGLLDESGKVGDTFGQQKKVEMEIRQNVVLDAQKVGEAMAKALAESLNNFLKDSVRDLQRQISAIRVGQQVRGGG